MATILKLDEKQVSNGGEEAISFGYPYQVAVTIEGSAALLFHRWNCDAAERAMAHVGPGQSLAIAQLPDGEDPDSLARSGGKEAVEAVIAAAVPLADWLFQTLLDLAA